MMRAVGGHCEAKENAKEPHVPEKRDDVVGNVWAYLEVAVAKEGVDRQ